MSEVEIINFIDEIYDEMKKFDNIMSLPNAKIKYKSIYMGEISEDYIKSLLLKDERFVFLNDKQFFLRNTLENIISKFQYDLSEIEKYIKENYFVEYIDRESLISEINNSKDILSIRYGNKTYHINNIDDFYNVVKEEGFVTYDVVRAVADHFMVDYYDVLGEMIETNVTVDELSKFNKYCGLIQNKKITDEHSVEVNNENILLISLHSNEIVACFLSLCYFIENQKSEYHSYYSDRHLYGLYKMSIIADQYKQNKVILTSSGRSVINSCNEFLHNTYYRNYLIDEIEKSNSSEELVKSNIIKEINNHNFWRVISEPMRKIYINNYYSRQLLKLISEGNNKGIYNLGDIILAHVRNGKRKVVRETLIGDRASSGNKAIRDDKDICLHCEIHRCSNSGRITKEKLLYYRTSYVNKFIKDVDKDINTLDAIFEDPLLIKFIVPYNLTSKNKAIMKYIQLLSSDVNILHKKDGKYCPFEDYWILKESTK